MFDAALCTCDSKAPGGARSTRPRDPGKNHKTACPPDMPPQPSGPTAETSPGPASRTWNWVVAPGQSTGRVLAVASSHIEPAGTQIGPLLPPPYPPLHGAGGCPG